MRMKKGIYKFEGGCMGSGRSWRGNAGVCDYISLCTCMKFSKKFLKTSKWNPITKLQVSGKGTGHTYYPMKKCGIAVIILPRPMMKQPIPINFGLCSLDPK